MRTTRFRVRVSGLSRPASGSGYARNATHRDFGSRCVFGLNESRAPENYVPFGPSLFHIYVANADTLAKWRSAVRS
jgi:hypothetical protein